MTNAERLKEYQDELEQIAAKDYQRYLQHKAGDNQQDIAWLGHRIADLEHDVEIDRADDEYMQNLEQE